MTKAFAIAIIFAGGVFLVFSTGIIDIPGFFDTPTVFLEDEEPIVNVHEEIEVVERDIVVEVEEVIESIVPENPLRSIIERPSSVLTNEGVFSWTNTQRTLGGASPLLSNSLLDSIAEFKMNDMFVRQYFAHDAPTGEGVSDLAEDFGYEFILVGENLALGDFEDDEALVTAWMDSPGHRENILNDRYRELGIAVGKMNFNGRDTWIAVQSFGAPLSVCGKVGGDLLAGINLRIDELDALEDSITDLQSELESTFPKRGALYISLVNNYNALVNEYNSSRAQLNSWIVDYNDQVNRFNVCINAI